MANSLYLIVSGAIFLMVALFHLFRLVYVTAELAADVAGVCVIGWFVFGCVGVLCLLLGNRDGGRRSDRIFRVGLEVSAYAAIACMGLAFLMLRLVVSGRLHRAGR